MRKTMIDFNADDEKEEKMSGNESFCLFCPQLFSRQTTYFHLHTLSLLLERRLKKSTFIDKDNIGVIANVSSNNQITLGVIISKKNSIDKILR